MSTGMLELRQEVERLREEVKRLRGIVRVLIPAAGGVEADHREPSER